MRLINKIFIMKNLKTTSLTRRQLKNIIGGTQKTCADVPCRPTTCNFNSSYDGYVACFINYTKVNGSVGFGPLGCWYEFCPGS